MLPTDRIRLYNRVALQRELTAAARDHWLSGLADASAFQEQYTDQEDRPAQRAASLIRPRMPSILDGVRNEDELVDLITPKLIKDSGSGETLPQERPRSKTASMR